MGRRWSVTSDRLAVQAEGWDYNEFDAPHMVMPTAPDEVAALLRQIARRDRDEGGG